MAISLDLAISAIRSGRKEEGRQLLNLLIQQNPNDERAWLWMSSVVTTAEQKARCLYHVLAIDPDNALARKGLQLLGVTVTDSRPVKIPALQTQRLSHPAPVPHTLPELAQPIVLRPATLQPRLAALPAHGQAALSMPDSALPPQPAAEPEAAPAEPEPENEPERRPFLIDPQAITQELPVAPVYAPSASQPPLVQTVPEVKASPAILYMNLDEILEKDDLASEIEFDSETPAPNPAEFSPEPDNQDGAVGVDPAGTPLAADAVPQGENNASVRSPLTGSTVAPPSGGPGGQVPHDTRPTPLMPGFAPNQPSPSPSTVYPPYAQYPLNQGYSLFYGQPTPPPPAMGVPYPYQASMRPPSEPAPVIHPLNAFGMASPLPGFHSNVTMMMPTMSEAEARARLAGLPATDASALALQSAAPFSLGPAFADVNYEGDEEDEEQSDEINIMAVIIFGTLSVTALGGFGMLILLVFTAPVL